MPHPSQPSLCLLTTLFTFFALRPLLCRLYAFRLRDPFAFLHFAMSILSSSSCLHLHFTFSLLLCYPPDFPLLSCYLCSLCCFSLLVFLIAVMIFANSPLFFLLSVRVVCLSVCTLIPLISPDGPTAEVRLLLSFADAPAACSQFIDATDGPHRHARPHRSSRPPPRGPAARTPRLSKPSLSPSPAASPASAACPTRPRATDDAMVVRLHPRRTDRPPTAASSPVGAATRAAAAGHRRNRPHGRARRRRLQRRRERVTRPASCSRP